MVLWPSRRRSPSNRDIDVRVIAQGDDPATVHLAQGEPVTIGADDNVEQPLQTVANPRYVGCPSLRDTEWSAW